MIQRKVRMEFTGTFNLFCQFIYLFLLHVFFLIKIKKYIFKVSAKQGLCLNLWFYIQLLLLIIKVLFLNIYLEK